MAKVYRGAAILAAVLLPAAATAQEPDTRPEGVVEVEPERERARGTRDRGSEARVEPADFETEKPKWGIVEHELRVEPVEAKQPAELRDGDLPERPKPEWPNDHLYDGWDYGNSFSYPQVYPNVGARLLNVVGDVDSETNFISRFEAELYLLHFGVTYLESIGGDRTDATYADVDLRIPIGLGQTSQLAIMPGVSFPIDATDKSEETTNVRAQAIYAFGAGGLGLQLRGGITEGTRPAGLLAVNERIDGTAALYGGMVAWRVLPPLQLRVEAAGEIAASDDDVDRLTLLPGVVFFPWGDPRLHLGLTAVVEAVSEDLDEDPNYGGLLDLGIFFY
ncbi:hypothetical protein [Vulgatibacter sp.]|uniref:hypothetical protein n=1 Tax=Vulgatibacter sp. TaxID=1971226 RepID=UPI00356924FA